MPHNSALENTNIRFTPMGNRYDDVGLFWENTSGSGILPTYDDSWKPVRDFPNLTGAKVLGLDTETYDPGLMDRGPGWGYGIGHIIGASLATEDGESWYFPIRHKVQKEINMDPEKVLRFLNDVLSTNIPKVGANLQYDVGWLNQEGVTVRGALYDVQYAEALIDDVAKSYSLDTISKKYLMEGKEDEALYNWIRRAYGNKGDPRANMYRTPPSLAGPYAEADALKPLQLFPIQYRKLQMLGMDDLFKLECKLIPVLIGMRMRGMLVDTEAAETAIETIENKIVLLREELKDFAGFEVGEFSAAQISRMFDSDGEEYPLTSKENPSFTKDWLKYNPYKGAQLIYDIRRYSKAVGTFLRGAILDKSVDNILKPSLHPLRGEDGGAVSGRFSSSKPNGQQFTARDNELAPLIRGCFIPEHGLQWAKIDYSQIEYRFFAHFSESAFLMQAYKDPKTDFHETVRKMLHYTGDRTPVKNVNFGMIYGMGKAKLLATLHSMGLDMDPEAFFNLYHEKFPEAKQMLDKHSDMAADTGEIRTILNRRNTFNMFEPVYDDGPALPYKQAIREYGSYIRRAMTHKALNRRLQGSSADLMKKSMVDCHEAGIFDTIGFPYITVHDEIDIGYCDDYKAEFDEMIEIMQNCIPLRVPVLADMDLGPDWGHLK